MSPEGLRKVSDALLCMGIGGVTLLAVEVFVGWSVWFVAIVVLALGLAADAAAEHRA